jgi:uncharacterized hydrophobic protein (TIGR00271 family)
MLKKLTRYISLASEVDDFDVIHDSIEKGTVFKGTNLWILVFAIVVASVGLNMNSTAVIIGAMLISPLMGPINGMGYSLATYNFPLFRKAVRNFSFAVLASLVASTAYFLISPVSTAHSELLARTSPTIYDVLIAFFGGLAGIVAISSKLKGQVIPGVAIATALMPPLCTAGYGMATGQFDFFFGALYLFTINTVFIAIASVIITKVLGFPILTLVDKSDRHRVSQWISFVIVVTLLPSIYFGWGLVEKERFQENAARYVSSVRLFERNFLLRHVIDPKGQTITLTYGGVSLTDEQKEKIRAGAAEYGLAGIPIQIEQGLELSDLDGKNSELDEMRAEIAGISMKLYQKEAQLDSVLNLSAIGLNLLEEIRPLYPQITGCLYSEGYDFGDSDTLTDRIPVVIFTHRKGSLQPSDLKKVEGWLKSRLGKPQIRVFFEAKPV